MSSCLSIREITSSQCLPGMLNSLAGLSERGRAGASPATSRLEDPMVFAKEQRTEEMSWSTD